MSTIRLALACHIPDLETTLAECVEDHAFVVDGRAVELLTICASLAELERLLVDRAVDVALVTSQFNAASVLTLASLARRGPVAVLDDDPDAARWDGFPGVVSAIDDDSRQLIQALGAALRGADRPRQRIDARRSGGHQASPGQPLSATQSEEVAPTSRGKIFAVASAYQSAGKSTLARSLAMSLGVLPGSTVLVGTVGATNRLDHTPMALGLDPSRNLAQLAERQLGDEAAWTDALRAELQAIGQPSHAQVLVGVPRPSLRTKVVPRLYEQLLDALVRRFDRIILDTGGSGWSSADSEIDCLALERADVILLVLRPTEMDVAAAREGLRDFRRRDGLHLVLNQTGQPDEESRRDIEPRLGLDTLAEIPFDARGVRLAARHRRPLVCEPRAVAAGPLLELAVRLGGGTPIPLPPDPESDSPRPWWRRLVLASGGAS